MTNSAEADQAAEQAAQSESFREWYRNDIWGKQAQDDDALFEVMSLQVFQAGLTWNMVLARRDAFREAFHGWRVDAVANMDPQQVDRLVQDPSIIRNRRKIEACIANARTVQSLQNEHGSFCHWFYHVLQGGELGDFQSALRKTFRFMGPEIARMWLLASGRVSREQAGH